MPEAKDYFEIVKTSIAAELAIPLDTITTGTRLGDLGLDSLDVLNVTFRIEQSINEKIPIQRWLAEIAESDVSLQELSIIDLCGQLASILHQADAPSSLS